jgi:flagellar protein FliO/FliZ
MKFWPGLLLFCCQFAVAAGTVTPVDNTANKVGLTPSANVPGLGEVVISLALVLGAILALALLYKKMQLKMPGNRHFKVVATLAVGPKERILVIELQGKQRVIGVTAHSVNFLFELENPLPEEKLASDFHSQLQSFLKK